MKPRGPLMIEHRLIEKVLKIVEKQTDVIRNSKKVDPIFIDTVVDFIKTYADRTHHGKEEDILFKELEKKNMSLDDKKIMEDLINEHKFARSLVKQLIESKNQYAKGDEKALATITAKLNELTKFYPVHIEKEDKVFFPNTEKYFSAEELDRMLAEFWEFDRKMIHEKYQKVFEELGNR